MMKKQDFYSFTLMLIFLLHCAKMRAQAAAAPAQAGPIAAPVPPSPPPPTVLPFPAAGPDQSGSGSGPGPTNVTKILEKTGHFSFFNRLLKSTTVIDQIEHQLNETNSGLTIFAPPDDAFSGLSSGTFNSITDGQKELLMQFHVLSSYIPLARFKNVGNPLRTNAGDNSRYAYQLNATSLPNSVNITTGITNATLSGVVYTDGQLAIYKVDKVLLPWSLFGSKPPASAPAPAPAPAPALPLALAPASAKPEKQNATAVDDDSPSDDDKKNVSGAVSHMGMQNAVLAGTAVVAAAIFSL